MFAAHLWLTNHFVAHYRGFLIGNRFCRSKSFLKRGVFSDVKLGQNTKFAIVENFCLTNRRRGGTPQYSTCTYYLRGRARLGRFVKLFFEKVIHKMITFLLFIWRKENYNYNLLFKQIWFLFTSISFLFTLMCLLFILFENCGEIGEVDIAIF